LSINVDANSAVNSSNKLANSSNSNQGLKDY